MKFARGANPRMGSPKSGVKDQISNSPERSIGRRRGEIGVSPRDEEPIRIGDGEADHGLVKVVSEINFEPNRLHAGDKDDAVFHAGA